MIKRLAMLSVHTSPLAPMGGKKTGGMNVYIRELAQELGARGIAVDIFTRRTSFDEPEIDHGIGENVRVIYLSAGPVGALKPDAIFPHLPQFTARLMAFATRHSLKYDIIYSHYWLSGAVGQKLKESWGTPFVQMFHTLGQMKQRILSHSTIMPNQRICTETEIVSWADRIVAATPAEHSQLMWLYRANRRKIEIIPPGVNTARFHPLSQADAQHELGYEPQEKILLFVGRIEPLKAVDTIIQALAYVRQHNAFLLENIRFAVVGGDPNDTSDSEMMRLQQLTTENNLTEVVQFLGAKDQNILPTYYAAATAVIMPSDYESFGMVALEAMATGTPVIASNVGGLAYLVKDEETGFLVPVREPQSIAECITRLVSDDTTSKRMGEQASQLAHEYAWHNIADRLLGVFDDILGRKSTQAV
ncbi:MAG: glycosyltransferase [Chloroflexota bacterium]